MIESMILFPEMFSKSPTKFERAAAYLIAEYNSVSASLRDLFTAGGKVNLSIKGKKVLVPRFAYHLKEKAQAIKSKIDKIDDKTLEYYWRIDEIKPNKLTQWKILLDEKFNTVSGKIRASDIFDSGL